MAHVEENAMQLRGSLLALATLLLALVSPAAACEATHPALSESVPALTGYESTGSVTNDPRQVEFALPNWLLLLDHEGDSFFVLSHSRVVFALDEDGLSEMSERSTAGSTEAPAILVDDEGIPLLSVAHQEHVEPEITASVAEEAPAFEGYEDR
jgi:hypothetical protein